MVTSGVEPVLPLPIVDEIAGVTFTAPSRPEIGAVMVAKPSWTWSSSIVAWSAATVPAAAFSAASA